jgi:hypothetical protein
MFEMNFETNINNINYINYMEQQEKEKLQLEKVNVAAEEYLKEGKPTNIENLRLNIKKS